VEKQGETEKETAVAILGVLGKRDLK